MSNIGKLILPSYLEQPAGRGRAGGGPGLVGQQQVAHRPRLHLRLSGRHVQRPRLDGGVGGGQGLGRSLGAAEDTQGVGVVHPFDVPPSGEGGVGTRSMCCETGQPGC